MDYIILWREAWQLLKWKEKNKILSLLFFFFARNTPSRCWTWETSFPHKFWIKTGILYWSEVLLITKKLHYWMFIDLQKGHIHLHPSLDSSNRSKKIKPKVCCVKKLPKEIGMVDEWRESHPLLKCVTFFPTLILILKNLPFLYYIFMFNLDRHRITNYAFRQQAQFDFVET